MSEDDLLDNEMRMQIVSFLEEKGEQGAHLREIQRIIGCGISSLLWHLQALDDFNLVTHHKIGKYHIFYLTGVESLQTTEIALALKSDVAKELCRVLLRKIKPLSLSKISSEIDVHHSSIQHHIKRLSDLSVIIILKEKKRSSYIVNPNKVESLSKILEVAS
jgi:predicted transcriptional regulator